MPVDVTDASFDAEVLKSDVPVVVDFWAEWCGPCKMLAPVLDEVEASMAGKVKIAKVDVDSNPASPQTYGVRGFPTLLLVKNGEVVGQKMGLQSKSALESWVSDHV